jgi:hypothetical protein
MKLTINGKPLPEDGTPVTIGSSPSILDHVEASLDAGFVETKVAKPKRQRSLAQIHARIARRLPVTAAESRRAWQDTRSR